MALMNDIQATWVRCQSGRWCSLADLDLASVGEDVGVYVIWRYVQPLTMPMFAGGRTVAPPRPQTVYVGQGFIADRLGHHQIDPTITQYGSRSIPLLVTWAAVGGWRLRNGVERFLADALRPMEGKLWPAVQPIRINLPPIF